MTSLPKKRPAETVTALAGAAALILVLTTGMDEKLAAALVAVVGAIPAIVTRVVNLRRSTAAGQLLINLTPDVARLAKSALDAARPDNVSLQDKRSTLKDVTESIAAWSDVVAAEPGAEPEENG